LVSCSFTLICVPAYLKLKPLQKR